MACRNAKHGNTRGKGGRGKGEAFGFHSLASSSG
jgi:hypothetical protein